MEQEIILEARNITKVYPGGVVANHNVNLQIRKGEIHALVGENGAGKSTLMKMLFGMLAPTEGQIFVDGKEVHFSSSSDAIAAGLGMVHQHFMQVPSMTVAENLILGAETGTVFKVDRKEAVRITTELSDKYNLKVEAKEKVEDISLAMRQKLEILKALYRGAHILILDEPTAVLTPQETEELFEQLVKLKTSGLTIIFISHKLNEIKQICERITIMRHGRSVGTYQVKGLTMEEISRLMVGRDIILNVEKKEADTGKVKLSVRHIHSKDDKGKLVLDDVSFDVRAGEIVGIAGVEGSGQEELVQIITGMKPTQKGKGDIRIEDSSVLGSSTKIIRKKGVSYIPEDRTADGAALDVTIRENLISSIYDTELVNKGVLLDGKKISAWVEKCQEDYDIRCDSLQDKIGMLSGGNMQKVVVAREFSTNPSVLIADQPTRGVDVGAIEFIHKKIVEIRDEGCAVLLVSADLNEILELADSILVMHQGKVAGYFPKARELSEEELGYYMLGVKQQSEEEIRRACFEK